MKSVDQLLPKADVALLATMQRDLIKMVHKHHQICECTLCQSLASVSFAVEEGNLITDVVLMEDRT
jgi:hypothetical protein